MNPHEDLLQREAREAIEDLRKAWKEIDQLERVAMAARTLLNLCDLVVEDYAELDPSDLEGLKSALEDLDKLKEKHRAK